MPKCKYCKKFFRTNKSLQMHIFQVHERRGTKTDKVNFEWKKRNYFQALKSKNTTNDTYNSGKMKW